MLGKAKQVIKTAIREHVEEKEAFTVQNQDMPLPEHSFLMKRPRHALI